MPGTPHGDSRFAAGGADQQRSVRRVTWVGLLANLALFGAKLAAGLLARSQAVVADAVHSLSDSVTDIAILVGSHFWSRPPDTSHPYGHRRIETLVSIFIGAVLCAAGVGIGWRAVATLHRGPGYPPGGAAFWVLVLAVVIKEALYRWTCAMGRRLQSISLQANAWHHRSDALSSIPAALAVAGAVLFPGWGILDHVGAVIVAVIILHAAYRIIWPRVAEIVERGAPRDVQKRIISVARGVEGVADVHALRSRYVGPHLHVDLHVLVNGKMSVEAAHDIATHVSGRVVEDAPGVLDVVVHVEPA